MYFGIVFRTKIVGDKVHLENWLGDGNICQKISAVNVEVKSIDHV